MLPKSEMPVAPLEAELVDAIREALTRLGILNWSGRIRVFGHKTPYLPVLGKGTPDILYVRAGRLGGLEAKRDDDKNLNPHQVAWHRLAKAHRIRVTKVASVEEAIRFVLADDP
jgi:hypothetical protein